MLQFSINNNLILKKKIKISFQDFMYTKLILNINYSHYTY